MRVLVLGAGATGAYFGARLIQAGSEVHFLVRTARAEALRRDGLRINSPQGNFSASVNLLTQVPAQLPFDLVLLACKAYDLDAALAAIAPAVGETTRVLPLLNGLRHLGALDLAFGAQRVWGGLCHISVALQNDGSVLHLGQLHRLTFGARSADARLDELAPALQAMPAEVRRSDSVLTAMWEKFAFLASLAGMTSQMRAAVGEIVATPDGVELMRRCYAEACAIAAAEGHAIATPACEEAKTILTAAGSPLKASMLRDLQRGAVTECEHILGDLIQRAAAHGVDAPLLRAATTHLRVYERSRLAG
ncbi:ketopantoate reductase [Tahibacter aquaticus]|uniref:2-dehydropantoate 2-reductase n=1 Tax=Tahibacter aquaticus TaxID=520092 RepID=A0A4R6YNV5_9GAMM|nr:2-dehydropantoate 2-reductase [Tahibacter aquaticus]TDR39380.1 ketopantoate reductase [Tahibacter aquaticus]